MAEYSRTKKYKDLRDSLQHETDPVEDELETKELSRFKQRLNRIDANNFGEPTEVRETEHEAVHARSNTYRTSEPEPQPVRKQPEPAPRAEDNPFVQNENFNDIYTNDYVDQYIREVKQYNIDQGNAVSENTNVNILRQMSRQPLAEPVEDRQPSRPYPNTSYSEQNSANMQNTTDIPFSNPIRRKYDELLSTQSLPVIQQDEPDENDDSQTMSKEDIMAEVQNLVNGQRSQAPQTIPPQYDETYSRHLEAERTTRQQLLNETTQMRAQLDDYEDNLSAVNDKVKRTNTILNIVLIVLIFALVVILIFMIYWLFFNK